jgi:hypothetical protein
MSRIAELILPLKTIRKSCGLSYEDVAAQMSAILHRPISWEYVRLLEYRGTIKSANIRALSEIYKLSFVEIEKAAEPRKNILATCG